MKKAPLRVIPLGGLGEIGMNMMVIECGPDAIIVDCGVMFPESAHYGVDLIIPDFSYVLKIKHKIRGLVLTHGHEDHIGAVPYLFRYIKPRIYGSRFTMALIKEKFESLELKMRPTLEVTKAGQKIKLGCFTVDFLPVSHSIIDGMGLAIQTPQGTIVHTADFKIDEDPYHGKVTTLKPFEAYGKKGVLLLLSDSTNVERKGKSLTENQIKEELFKICKKAQGRIIFSVFATNIRRVEQMLEIATRLNRKVFVSGRGMERNVGIAKKLKIIPPNMAALIHDLKEIGRHKAKDTMVICTGSQAEFGSALWRMSIGEHRQVRVNEIDTIVLSSRYIPGNEKVISHLINNLYRRGAEVFYSDVASVHVSGHAYENELKRMIQAVRPTHFMPVHGEYRHLVRHGLLAESMKIPKRNVFVCENGEGVEIIGPLARRIEGIPAQQIFVDGRNIRGAQTFALKDRRQLSETGVIFVLLIRNQKNGAWIEGPELFSKGVLFDEDEAVLLERAKKHLTRVLHRPSSGAFDLQTELRIEIRRFFKKEVGKKPVVMPLVIDV